MFPALISSITKSPDGAGNRTVSGRVSVTEHANLTTTATSRLELAVTRELLGEMTLVPQID